MMSPKILPRNFAGGNKLVGHTIIKGRPHACRSIAASTVRCYCSWSWARLHAVCRPMLSALRSFSMVRVHDCLGRPGGRLQWLGNPEITARSALKWSIRASDLASCLRSRRRLSHRTVGSCVWLVRFSTSVLNTVRKQAYSCLIDSPYMSLCSVVLPECHMWWYNPSPNCSVHFARNNTLLKLWRRRCVNPGYAFEFELRKSISAACVWNTLSHADVWEWSVQWIISETAASVLRQWTSSKAIDYVHWSARPAVAG